MRLFTKIYVKLLSYILLIKYQLKKRIHLGKGVIFIGFSTIYTRNKASIFIGDNVTIYSISSSYHASMHSPCKIVADKGGAIIRIGNKSRIKGVCIHAHNEIIIGKRCLIGANTQIIDSNGHELSMNNPSNRINTISKPKQVHIGDDVWIGINTIILPGTKIGNGSIVVAGSVVRGEFPQKSLIGGNPAVILKDYSNE